MPDLHLADLESLTIIVGFAATVLAAWWRATRWCLTFVSMHEDISVEVQKLRVDVGVLVDQMHELARAVHDTAKDTERLETRFDTLNGKYPKN